MVAQFDKPPMANTPLAADRGADARRFVDQLGGLGRSKLFLAVLRVHLVDEVLQIRASRRFVAGIKRRLRCLQFREQRVLDSGVDGQNLQQVPKALTCCDALFTVTVKLQLE